MSEMELNYFRVFVQRVIDCLEKAGEKTAAATYCYSLANHYRAYCMRLAAIGMYKRALRNDTQYLSRSYFCSEVASLLFTSNHFMFSSIWYKRALELHAPPETVPLYADALMYSGKYSEALKLFTDYLDGKEEQSSDSEWILKVAFLDLIVKKFDILEQRRAPSQARSHLFHKLGANGIGWEVLTEVVAMDALSNVAWFNMATHYHANNMIDDAIDCYTFAALTSLTDVESWSKAFLLAIGLCAPRSAAIFANAYRLNGYSFLESLYEHIRKSCKEDDALGLMDLVAEMAAELGGDKNRFVVRNVETGEVLEI